MTDITKSITEGDTYKAAQIETLVDRYWAGSLFEWFRHLPSPKTKGCRGELMVADMLEALGCDIPRNKEGKPTKPKGSGSDFDLYPDKMKVEVKTSSAWDAQDNKFTWQQLRSMQDYDRVVFLGLNPNQAQSWWCTKEDLEQHIFGCNEFRQHGGKAGKQDIYWLQTPAGDLADVPSWFRSMDTWND